MIAKKIYYNCPYCNKAYWVSPLYGGDQDVVVEHPCTCGSVVKLELRGVAELSLMEEEE